LNDFGLFKRTQINYLHISFWDMN